jgi:penicillin-binding protein 2
MNTPVVPGDRRNLTIRLTVFQYVVAIGFAALAVGFWIFQIAQHQKFLEIADNNRLRKLPLPAPRGQLFDRSGKVLVDNQSSLNIALVREQTKNVGDVLRTLAAATGAPEAQLRDTVNRRRHDPSFRPIVLIDNASREQVIAAWARRLELPGIIYQEVPARKYPASDMAAHLFGYVGEVTDAQLQRSDYDGVEPGTIVGQAGVEQAYNRELMGTEGNKTVVVNSVGREIEELGKQDPTVGHALQLTIDSDIQKAIEDGFEASGFNGAAVVLDPSNGEVLGFTSRPSYDPNAFASGIDRATWASLNSDGLKPLQDRAIQGRYSPGSTFKMAVALAALQSHAITPGDRFHCPGFFDLGNARFHCWRKGGHGSLDLRGGIKNSCDVFFYQVALRAGIDPIAAMAHRLGMGTTLEIDLPSQRAGLIPTREWRRARGHPWNLGDTVVSGIGQGYVQVTPLQLATYAARLATGRAVQPHLTRKIAGELLTGAHPGDWPELGLPPRFLAAVREGMWAVVNGRGGTAPDARLPDPHIQLAGKTGSAQVRRVSREQREHGFDSSKLPWKYRPNALFVAYAPYDGPRYAVSVVIEHGNAGATAAAPMARDIMIAALARDPANRTTAPGGGLVAQADPA